MLVLPSRRIVGSERFNATTSKAVLTGGGAEQESGRAVTMLAHVYKHGAGEGAIGTIYSRSSGSTQYLTLSSNPSNGRAFRFAAHSSGISGAPHVNTEDRMVTTGREWQHVAATWTGGLAASSMQAFVARDGEPLSRSVSGSQGGTTAVLDSGSATLNIGNRDDSARTWDGWIHYVARWDRVLDLSELLLAQRYGPEAVMNGLVMLYRDGRDWSPTGLSVARTDILGGPAPSIRSTARRTPVFVSLGGATNYTLAADAGAYTLTGGAATLRVGRRLTAAAGSFALTGGAAGLYVARRLSADAAAYTFVGNDATLTYSAGATNYTLTADAGSFALAGGAATLRVGRVLSAAQGAYSVTGNAASFARTYRLSADAGAYSLIGNAANLLYSGAESSLWTPQTLSDAAWTPQSASAATWTPQ